MELRDGSSVEIRPIEPGDAGRLRKAYEALSETSRRRRFLTPAEEIGEEDLRYLTDVDHHRHEAMIALAGDRAVGVARFVQVPGDREAAEVAVTVADDWQRRGLGTALLERLTARARETGLRRYTAVVSPDNSIVLDALERAGAERTGVDSEGQVEFSMELPADGIGERLRSALRAAASAPLEFLAVVRARLPRWMAER